MNSRIDSIPGSSFFSGHDNILITDIGSTTTKAVLLGIDADGVDFIGAFDVPTTVEKPFEDVGTGILSAVTGLEKQTGIRITDDSGKFRIPYLTTSSAGGGLQILVFGLTSVETGRVAEVTAYGAGGVILRTMTIDDETPAVDKMRLMRDLHPDLILMAGGFDGGAIATVVSLAELLTLANPQPKFRQNMKIPLVFCGNVEARKFVTNVLEDTFDVHMVENVRPSSMHMNLRPAKERVHQLFMDNVMERAPGYSEVKKMVSADIIPTPAGVENILKLYGDTLDQNVLMMDMGGATTDIYSNIIGQYHRTVAANIGMSYSASNIILKCGIESIMSHLPDSFDESAVRDYIANKTLYPTYVPELEEEILVEHALAIEGASIAWSHHLDINFKTKKLGFLDRLKMSDICKFEQQFFTQDDKPFCLSDIGTIIGAGGVISHTDRTSALRILAEIFRPHGITKLVIDRDFRSPHMGVLATIDPETARRLFSENCLEEVGFVVAPTGNVKPGKHALEIRSIDKNQSWKMDGGKYLYFPSGGNFEFIPAKGISFGRDEGSVQFETVLPVIIDCCGRGEDAVDEPLSRAGMPEFTHLYTSFRSNISPDFTKIDTGEFEVECRLPYEGSILVKEGDRIEPGDIVAENRHAPPRLYILDLNRIPGYDRHLTWEEISDGLKVGVGDTISLGQSIYGVHRPGITGFSFNYASPVRGKITRIEKTGLVILREIQDYDGRPHVIDVASRLGVRPSRMRGYLQCRIGDFVGTDQAVAKNTSSGIFVKSPSSGIVKEIDTDNGTITVQYDIKPVPLHAYVTGTVSRIQNNSVVWIKGSGTRIYGTIGFGSQAFGKICLSDETGSQTLTPGTVVVFHQPVSCKLLQQASESEVAGIVAPSIHNGEWVKFYGQELGVALTGDESIPFTLILTEGFGDFRMNDKTWNLLSNAAGKTASLSGRTQIRAGVTRPHVIVGV